jgi:primosomal protein N' (replication factor Y)
LGSATPSIESFYNAKKGKYILHALTDRFNQMPLPEVEMVDMREQVQNGEISFLSSSLRDKLIETIQNKRQAILFLNRRGTHTHVMCQKCGYVLKCPNCGISMTYHSANNRCICHFCSYSVKMIDKCPACSDTHIKMTGYGTQHVEKQLAELLPDCKILRMDMDTVTNYVSYQTMLSDFAEHKYDILLGTQMVAKGLNFPNVTLVGVISIDQQLYNDDFRSSEKAFDLLTQVVGRSGRGDFLGKAVIQTMLPDNDIITLASNQDYEGFFETENVIRKAMLYPPYCDICSLTFISENSFRCSASANRFLELLKLAVTSEYNDVKVNVLGPLQPKVAKINNKYRNVITIKCRNNKRFRAMISSLLVSFMKDKINSGVTVTADINPLS